MKATSVGRLPRLLRAIQRPRSKLGKAVGGVKDKLTKGFKALAKEKKMGPVLHAEVLGALRRMKEQDARVEKALAKAYGYAVIPSIGKVGLVLVGAYGVGEVFEQGRVVGYAALAQLTIGVQLGGSTFHALVLFDNREALKRFKGGKTAFAANASLVLIKGANEKLKGFAEGTRMFWFTEGGLMASAAIGGQKLIYRPAALGKLRTDEGESKAKSKPSSASNPAQGIPGHQAPESQPSP
jgi:lipid-binding SYLF domain-containing protein